VIQTAAKIVIEPIFEADFEDNAYGQARQEPPGDNLLSGPHAPLHAEPKRNFKVGMRTEKPKRSLLSLRELMWRAVERYWRRMLRSRS
jgi:hypothetical protein